MALVSTKVSIANVNVGGKVKGEERKKNRTCAVNRLSASTTQTQFSILHRRRLHLHAEQIKRRLKTEENEEYDGFLRTLEQRETRLSM